MVVVGVVKAVTDSFNLEEILKCWLIIWIWYWGNSVVQCCFITSVFLALIKQACYDDLTACYIFQITGRLGGESTRQRPILYTKGQWCRAFLVSVLLNWGICLTNSRVPAKMRRNIPYMTSSLCPIPIIWHQCNCSTCCNFYFVSA